MAKKSFLPWLVAWLLIAATVAVGLGSINWFDYYRLLKRGVTAHGVVLSGPDPENHYVSDYSYTVGSRTFRDRGYPGAGAGQTITVYYLPDSPTVNCVSDPKALLRYESMSVGLAALILPTFLLVVLRWRFNMRMRSSTGASAS